MWQYLIEELTVPVSFALTEDKTLFGTWYTIEACSGPYSYEREFEEHEKEEVVKLINNLFG